MDSLIIKYLFILFSSFTPVWDQTKFFRFRWLWYETPTFAPYEVENGYENSLLVQQSGGLALSSLAHVMRSLTPNARQIFLVLAEYQLENGDNANYTGQCLRDLSKLFL